MVSAACQRALIRQFGEYCLDTIRWRKEAVRVVLVEDRCDTCLLRGQSPHRCSAPGKRFFLPLSWSQLDAEIGAPNIFSCLLFIPMCM